MPGNNSGRRQPGNSAVPSTVGRLGVDGFWIRDYGGGGPGRPPCWRTLKESCKGLGSVSLKNKQPTHTHHAKIPGWYRSVGVHPVWRGMGTGFAQVSNLCRDGGVCGAVCDHKIGVAQTLSYTSATHRHPPPAPHKSDICALPREHFRHSAPSTQYPFEFFR